MFQGHLSLSETIFFSVSEIVTFFNPMKHGAFVLHIFCYYSCCIILKGLALYFVFETYNALEKQTNKVLLYILFYVLDCAIVFKCMCYIMQLKPC